MTFKRQPKVALPQVVPPARHPTGLVISITENLIGESKDEQAIMKTVKVRWSDLSWNGKNGFSEEHHEDLFIIQES